jgi:hypothetical protein
MNRKHGVGFLKLDKNTFSLSCARQILACALSGALFFAGCTVGPKYQRPSVTTPEAFKELTPADYPSTDGWKKAQPKDAALKGKWWEIFNDAQLTLSKNRQTCPARLSRLRLRHSW